MSAPMSPGLAQALSLARAIAFIERWRGIVIGNDISASSFDGAREFASEAEEILVAERERLERRVDELMAKAREAGR